MAAPATNDADTIRQILGQDIAPAVMRVLQQDFGRPCRDRAIASGNRLRCHQGAEFRIGRMRLGRLIPMVDAGDTFDIDADIDFHRVFPPKRRPKSVIDISSRRYSTCMMFLSLAYLLSAAISVTR